MANKTELPSNWVCDGKELKPKSGASFSNTWVFDGKEIKPKTGASFSNTWIWDGKELKPKTVLRLSIFCEHTQRQIWHLTAKVSRPP